MNKSVLTQAIRESIQQQVMIGNQQDLVLTESVVESVVDNLAKYQFMFMERGNDNISFIKKGQNIAAVVKIGSSASTLEFSDEAGFKEFLEQKKVEGFVLIKKESGIKNVLKGLVRFFGTLLKAVGWIALAVLALWIVSILVNAALMSAAGYATFGGMAGMLIGQVAPMLAGVSFVGFTSYTGGWLLAKVAKKSKEVVTEAIDATQQSGLNDNVCQFSLEALAFADIVHTWHWVAQTESEHETLGEFYEAIRTAVDGIVEAYMANGGQMNTTYTYQLGGNVDSSMKASLIKKFKNRIEDMINSPFSLNSSVKVKLEELAAIVDKHIYLLRMA